MKTGENMNKIANAIGATLAFWVTINQATKFITKTAKGE